MKTVVALNVVSVEVLPLIVWRSDVLANRQELLPGSAPTRHTYRTQPVARYDIDTTTVLHRSLEHYSLSQPWKLSSLLG
jgi:hypothetical protein